MGTNSKMRRTSLYDFTQRRLRLAGSAILDNVNPWFRPLDNLRDQAEARGGSLTSFANYDYLGLVDHPGVIDAAAKALARFGTGAVGSRLVGGERLIHTELENAIARFFGTEASLTLVSGYLTNLSIIAHLIGSRDLLIYDELCHNSIVAGVRASRSQSELFRHNDLDHLEFILKKRRGETRNCLIAVEGLYSMDGDIPELPRLLDLKDKYDAWLLIDEAHSLGVLGETGRGIAEHFSEDSGRIDLIIGTLSKALVSCGGFVCAQKHVIDFLKFTLGGFVYSVGLSPMVAAAAKAALDILASEPDRVASAQRAAETFLGRARDAGLATGPAIGRGIVPVMFRDLEETVQASESLLKADIYAPPIVHVGVPKDQPRIRFFLSAKHDGHPAIDAAIEILSRRDADIRGVDGRRPEPSLAYAATSQT
jgi:8-amino-7-oxononanoate synthase